MLVFEQVDSLLVNVFLDGLYVAKLEFKYGNEWVHFILDASSLEERHYDQMGDKLEELNNAGI